MAALIPLLGDEDQRVRSAAAKSLSSLADALFIDTANNLAFEKSKLLYKSSGGGSQTGAYSHHQPAPDSEFYHSYSGNVSYFALEVHYTENIIQRFIFKI